MSRMTTKPTLDQLVAMQWTWHGPSRVESDGSVHWEMTVEELPDFFVAATTYDEVIAELRPALRAFLQSYAERGEAVPVPANPTLWQVQALPIAASSERRHQSPPGAHITQAPMTAAA